MSDYLNNINAKRLANNKTIDKFNEVEKQKASYAMQSCFNTFYLEHYKHKTQDLERFKSRPWMTCKNKFCHICAYIKSKKTFVKSYLALEKMKADNIEFIGYHLTLTIKNPSAEKLNSDFLLMNKAFKNFIKNFNALNEYLLGWQVGREVSQSDNARNKNEFHPHIHCLLLLSPNFTNPLNRHNKITQSEFREKWRNACKYYNIEAHQISFKKIKAREDFINLYNEDTEVDPFLSAIAEVAKYPAKPADVQKMSADHFDILDNVLKNKRMMSTGGLLKKYLKKEDENEILKIDNYELINVLLADWENKSYKTYELTEHQKIIYHKTLK